jgi:hypothetical protein
MKKTGELKKTEPSPVFQRRQAAKPRYRYFHEPNEQNVTKACIFSRTAVISQNFYESSPLFSIKLLRNFDFLVKFLPRPTQQYCQFARSLFKISLSAETTPFLV